MKFSKLILFGVLFIGLILFQRDVVLPVIYDIIGGDWLLEDTEDLGDIQTVSTPLSKYAHMHCNTYIRDEVDPEISINFPEKAIYAWDIGNHQYVINSEIETINQNTPPEFHKYVCRISYSKGNNVDEAMNFDNWSVYGISGLDEI